MPLLIRLLILFFFALLIGAALNIALCWWLAAKRWDYPPESERIGWTEVEGRSWYVRQWSMWGSRRVDGVPSPAWATRGNTLKTRLAPPTGSFLHTPPDEPVHEMKPHVEDIRGWPWAAMSAVFRDEWSTRNWPAGRYVVVQGREVQPDPGAAAPMTISRTPPKALPTRILWPGFLANTFIAAAALMPLFILMYATARFAFTWKKRRRRKTGRCLACGYDLRGNFDEGCPECGWNRD